MSNRAFPLSGWRRAVRWLQGAIALLFLLAPASAFTQSGTPDRDTGEGMILPRIRERFYVAVEEAAVTEELIAYIERSFPGNPAGYPAVIGAYYAALEGLRGRHDTNLLRKYRYVTAAIRMMDPLVEAHPDLLEVRFLRFSFYEQIPGVFGVHHHVPGDLDAIMEMLGSGGGTEVPPAVRVDMIDYILDTDEPTPREREMLRELRARQG